MINQVINHYNQPFLTIGIAMNVALQRLRDSFMVKELAHSEQGSCYLERMISGDQSYGYG